MYASAAVALQSLPTQELALEAVAASSVDSPSQNAGLTLKHGSDTYWSCSGSETSEHPEWLRYQLVQPLCLVREVRYRFYQAKRSRGRPIFASRRVSIETGFSEEGLCCVGESEEWNGSREYVTVRLDGPLMPAGCVQVRFAGKVQLQRDDMQWYVVVTRVQIRGIALGALQCGTLACAFLNHALANEACVVAMERCGALPLAPGMLAKLKEAGACEDVHQIDKRKLLARVGHMPLRNRQGVAAVVWLRLVQLSIADKDPWQGVEDSSEDDDWFYH